jgi:hypothetical protein
MALDLPHTITTTTTNEDYDDDLFGNNGPENKTFGLQQLTEQHHRDLFTARKEERASLARKDPPGTPDLGARSTETRQAEEMRIADGEEEEEEPPRARIHPKGKADAALG